MMIPIFIRKLVLIQGLGIIVTKMTQIQFWIMMNNIITECFVKIPMSRLSVCDPDNTML